MKLVVQGDAEPYEPIMAAQNIFITSFLPVTNFLKLHCFQFKSALLGDRSF
jgi:hypothetical protein